MFRFIALHFSHDTPIGFAPRGKLPRGRCENEEWGRVLELCFSLTTRYGNSYLDPSYLAQLKGQSGPWQTWCFEKINLSVKKMFLPWLMNAEDTLHWMFSLVSKRALNLILNGITWSAAILLGRSVRKCKKQPDHVLTLLLQNRVALMRWRGTSFPESIQDLSEYSCYCFVHCCFPHVGTLRLVPYWFCRHRSG